MSSQITVISFSDFLCSVWKKCHNTYRQLLVSDVVWEYRKIRVFSHNASVLMSDKNPIIPDWFAQSVTLSVLSVLIGWSTLRFEATCDVSMSWLAVHALSSDSHLPTTEFLQTTQSVGSSWDEPACNRFISVKTGLKSESDNKWNKTQAWWKRGRGSCSGLASHKSHATANVSLFAH